METTSFAYQVTALKREFTVFCNEKLQEIGLSIGLMYFIVYIGKHENCSPGELSKAIHMDTGHTTRSIDKLVKDGFVQKKRAEVDKRSQNLILTDKGKIALNHIYSLFQQWDQIRLSQLSEEEQKTLCALLDKVRKRGKTSCMGGYKKKSNLER